MKRNLYFKQSQLQNPLSCTNSMILAPAGARRKLTYPCGHRQLAPGPSLGGKSADLGRNGGLQLALNKENILLTAKPISAIHRLFPFGLHFEELEGALTAASDGSFPREERARRAARWEEAGAEDFQSFPFIAGLDPTPGAGSGGKGAD